MTDPESSVRETVINNQCNVKYCFRANTEEDDSSLDELMFQSQVRKVVSTQVPIVGLSDNLVITHPLRMEQSEEIFVLDQSTIDF